MEDDILQEFLAESWENLSQLDTEIVSLEKDPSNIELLDSIFRTIHTIKGTCGFIGLTGLGHIAHSAENVLGKMRDGELSVSPGAISLVLEGVDEIKALLEGLEATGEEPQRDNAVLISMLDEFARGSSAESQSAEPQSSQETPAQSDSSPDPDNSSNETTEPSEQPASVQSESSSVSDTSGSSAEGGQPSKTVENETGKSKEESTKGTETSKTSIADLSIHVNVHVLDSLMNLVGELVLTRNQLLQLSRGDDESKYAAPITQLNRVTTDLQEGVMKTRMQPIGNAWSKLPRLVRDLSQVTGRQIELEMSGAETELDRTVLNAIKDPLTHMVRNSADHGIETPKIRREKGKPEIGTIKLNAFHEGGHVIISIQDDGAGINTAKVLKKAVEKGVVSEDAASKMSHSEILSLVFKTEVSTVEEVSSLSGRGVGMDVVKTAIDRIGGTVDLTSVENEGTTVRIKIPLTLAIISALVVESGGESFAIPQLGVVELVRLAAEDRDKIERIHDKEVFRLRDRLLPMVHLDEILELEDPHKDDDRDINIVVVQVGEEQFGLIVSEVFDFEEIVVKPVGSLLKDINIYQGTTILGDGRVIMILDVAGIAAQLGGLSANSSENEKSDKNDTESIGETTSLLLFDSGSGTTMSVPLSLVARLEEFPRETIERTGDKLVVQYRGDLLPLLPINGSVQGDNLPELQPVIVFSEGRSSMGLMVEEIQDILEEQLLIRMHSERPGVLGTAIINGKATDVIDTQHFIMTASPEWFIRNESQHNYRVLVIDDSLFFRQLVTTSLETEEFNVTSASSAVQAVEMIEHGERFDVIISDLEMPMMDGFEFAEWIKERPDGKTRPLIALSSLSGAAVETRALESGYDRYLTKFNAQQLIKTIEELSQEKASCGAKE